MPSPSDIRSIIEHAVAQGLETALPVLRDDIVARATEAVEALAQGRDSSPTALLSAAATQIQDGNGQAEILRHLLDGCSRFAARVALFVVKGGTVTGWQGTGFENNELIRGTNLSAGRGLMTDAIGGRVPASGKSSDFDAGFLAAVKSPAEDACLVLPLVVKDKAAALIYADGGEADGAFDASALSVLTRFAALCLETGTRKGDSGLATAQEYESAPPMMASAAASAAMPAAAPVAPLPAAAPAAQAFSSADDADLHKKAKRFAKLLVEEIMLYNQAKVAQGKKNQDLYTRLRDDIEKSRATYDKRYGESAAASADYFNQELIRILADNDVSLMGDGFPR